jgi:glutamyl-tRNA synthetase
MASPVITRFPPSPTGYLHIGSARTALFNWLYAKHTGGKMLLRIEDTDRERSTEAAVAAIIEGLEWLELAWDGDIVFQTTRAGRHREVAERLLAEGKAYLCFTTPEELEEMREKARAEGRPPRYDGRWRDRDPSTAPPGVRPVIRIKSPLDGETVIPDRVQGTVAFPNKDLDDFVLLRSDGTPTYMLSVVVDDHDMGVTHIIRGNDHFTNAARQKVIYDAAGWDVPVMAHIPLIHGSDGAKLSKRHGAVGIDAYRAEGYLPVAMRNYLVHLGWAHGDDEIMSTEQMIEWFDLDGIGRSPSRFDMAQLVNTNAHYMRTADPDWLLKRFLDTLPYLPEGPGFMEKLNPARIEQLRLAMPGLQERAKTLNELIEGAAFIFAERPLTPDAAASKILDDKGKAILSGFIGELEKVEPWSKAGTEAALRSYAEGRGLKLGGVAQPLRAALTGRTTSPGIFEVLEVLGRQESLARIRDQVAA